MIKQLLFAFLSFSFSFSFANDFLQQDYWQGVNVATVQKSIRQGHDVNARDADGFTVLMTALTHRSDMSVMSFLVESGADINASVKHGMSDIIFLPFDTQQSFLKTFAAFLQKSDGNPSEDTQDITVLMLTIFQANEFNNATLIQDVITLGADVNLATHKGITPLMLASLYAENPQHIQVLLDAGADVHVKNYVDKTAFDVVDENINYDPLDARWRAIKAKLKPL